MTMRIAAVLAALAATPVLFAASPAPTPAPAGDHVTYVPRYEDPVLKEMGDRDKELGKKADEETSKIREAQKARREQEKKARTTLRLDMSKIVKPASPAVFKQAWHFPPAAQYLTGTCWSFSTTSFYESEVYRLTGQQIRLSPMWTVYWEYVEKMRRFVRERGDSAVDEGSEANAFQRIWPKYGIVTQEAYPGVLAKDGRYDHSQLIAELHELCDWVKTHELWDEEEVLAMTRTILDRTMGKPPDHVTWQGATTTPQEFLARVLRLNMDDYVEMMSTLSAPFWTQAEYKVPDNWWHDAHYYNLPLEEWYAALKKAAQAGYTLAIGGDVSEPGYNGFENAAVVPSFDIPQAFINQDSREFRIDNHTTDDDHGIHLVGYAKVGGRDWFLIKDSARSSRWGKFEGYYFYRDDYVRLKMLAYTAPKEAMKELLARFTPPKEQAKPAQP